MRVKSFTFIVYALVVYAMVFLLPVFSQQSQPSQPTQPTQPTRQNRQNQSEMQSRGKSVADPQAKSGAQLYSQGKYTEAARAFEQHLRVNGNDAVSYYYAGLCYQQLGNLNRSLVMYKQVVRIAPKSRIAQYASSILQKLDPSWQTASASAASNKPDTAKPDDQSQADMAALSALLKGAAQGSQKTNASDIIAILGKREQEPPTDPAELAKLPERARIFYKSVHGGILLPVEINGRTIDMMFDTGAPHVVVSRADLLAVGLKPPEGPPTGQSGGSSNAMTVSYWDMYASVKVGPLKKERVKLRVLESNAAQPLLGQTFFKDFDYTIDHASSCIELRKKGAFKRDIAGSYSMPFRFRELGNRVIVDVEINGKKFPGIFDTGNTASSITFITIDQANRYGARITNNRVVSIGVSGAGEGCEVVLDRVKLGPIEKYNVIGQANLIKEAGAPSSNVGSASLNDELAPPLIGYDMIKGWEYTIDMNRKLIHFVRRN